MDELIEVISALELIRLELCAVRVLFLADEEREKEDIYEMVSSLLKPLTLSNDHQIVCWRHP